MGLFSRNKVEATTTPAEKLGASPTETPATLTPDHQSIASATRGAAPHGVESEKEKVTILAVLLGSIASIGGFMFGYESGQISGKQSIFRISKD